MRYKSLDVMIERGAEKMHSDPWYDKGVVHENDGGVLSVGAAWDELHEIHGSLKYRGHVFVVHHSPGERGMGGMDEGSPESITVYRINP